jgi:diguanylate cyclase (GGDEF)-like protein/hemerythrin-like metal-binding protein/PAS domain S-box-containing protein
MHIQFDIFPWNANFQVGIQVIDEQHQKLVSLINQLAGSIAANVEPMQSDAILDELKDYARYHFSSEEAIWHQYLPGDELETSHHTTHENFLTFIEKTRFEVNDLPNKGAHKKIIAFLIHWLAGHILESDKYLAGVCLEIQAGKSRDEARMVANGTVHGSSAVLSEALLNMIGDLSELSFQLSFEISQRQKIQAALAKSLSFTKAMINSMQDGLLTLDRFGLISEVNASLCSMTGFSSRELVGIAPPFPFMSGYSRIDIEQIFERTWKEQHYEFEAAMQSKSGRQFPAIVSMFHIKEEDGQFVTFAATVKDITERKDREDENLRLSLYDPLTSLANRRLFYDQLRRVMDDTQRSGKYFAIAYIDLDQFKILNDSRGHAIGDLFLQETGRRIKECVRAIDTASRFGGDEFVVLFNNLNPSDARNDAQQIAQKIRKNIEQPFQLPATVKTHGSRVLQCSASIGVTLSQGRKTEQDELLTQADLAMYRAKQSGRNQVCFHQSDSD